MKKYFQAPWSIKDLLIASLFSLVLALGVSRVGANISTSALLLMQWGIVLAPIVLLSSRKFTLKWEHFGFAKIKVLKCLGQAAKAYLKYFLLIFIFAAVMISTGIELPGFGMQESLIPLFGDSKTEIIIAGVVIIIIAPVVEEIYFRGIIFRTLQNKMPYAYASTVSALLFSALHTPWTSFFPIFILGLIMNSLVHRNQSLWPSIIFHASNNAIAFCVQLMIINGQIDLSALGV